jgi:hypothetical protein
MPPLRFLEVHLIKTELNMHFINVAPVGMTQGDKNKRSHILQFS